VCPSKIPEMPYSLPSICCFWPISLQLFIAYDSATRRQQALSRCNIWVYFVLSEDLYLREID